MRQDFVRVCPDKWECVRLNQDSLGHIKAKLPLTCVELVVTEVEQGVEGLEWLEVD